MYLYASTPCCQGPNAPHPVLQTHAPPISPLSYQNRQFIWNHWSWSFSPFSDPPNPPWPVLSCCLLLAALLLCCYPAPARPGPRPVPSSMSSHQAAERGPHLLVEKPSPRLKILSLQAATGSYFVRWALVEPWVARPIWKT